MEQNYTPPVIDSNASLKQACNQFNEELHKMLDRAAPQKKVRYADRPHISWFNNLYLRTKGNCQKQGSNLQKSQRTSLESLHHWKKLVQQADKIP